MKYFYQYLSIIFLGAVILSSCEKEEELQPSHSIEDFFGVPDDASGPESKLRRTFFQETGSYLIFNPVLKIKAGTDANGETAWETYTINFNYDITSTGTYQDLNITVIDDWETQQAAALFIKEEVLSHFDTKYRPFSVMPLNTIEYQSNEYPYDIKQFNYIENFMCSGFALGDIQNLTEEKKQELENEVVKNILSTKLKELTSGGENYTKYRIAFEEISNEYYGEYIIDLFPEWDKSQTEKYVYGLGFLDYNSYEDPYYDNFFYSSEDWDAYVEATYSIPENEFREQYGNYPLVIKKYEIMRSAFEEIGFAF